MVPFKASIPAVALKIFVLLFTVLFISPQGEKILVYDEEKGIIFIDPNEAPQQKAPQKKKSSSTVIKRKKSDNQNISRAKGPEDIHVNRKKDPPDLYLKSGREYYKNGDYKNAIKNFKYAADKDLKPEYLLWIGKASRQLDKPNQMLSIMERILKDYPDSEVADDALFEIAFYHQRNNDYAMATKKYAQLAEQYPFGHSYSNGEAFLEVSRKQRRWMRNDMLSTLQFIGIKGETVEKGYRRFQKLHALKVTGKGNQETVTAIKKAHRNKIEELERKAQSLNQLKEGLFWIYIAGFIILITFFVTLFIFSKAKQSSRQVQLLKGFISDLK